MDALFGLFDFIAKLGITGLTIAGAVWAIVQLGGEKWVNLYFDKKKESHKAEQQQNLKIRLAISERRLEPYRGLWNLMEPLSPRSGDPLDRSALETAFRKWYYASGNALFLSWKAMDAYVLATGLLIKTDVSDDAVRKAFSDLRTQMKKDMDVYTSDEATSQVGRGSVST